MWARVIILGPIVKFWTNFTRKKCCGHTLSAGVFLLAKCLTGGLFLNVIKFIFLLSTHTFFAMINDIG